jgi:hypothetical protein
VFAVLNLARLLGARFKQCVRCNLAPSVERHVNRGANIFLQRQNATVGDALTIHDFIDLSTTLPW